MESKVIGIIPSRIASTRFPAKPLALIAGKTMIERVYSQAKKSTLLYDVIVATDDESIANEVARFGGKFIMTDKHLNNGTERCAQALEILGEKVDAVVNIQGDEPIVSPQQIDQLVGLICKPDAKIATLRIEIKDVNMINNPNVVKVVGSDSQAFYFSRSAIPYIFDNNHLSCTYFKHIGLYAYKAETLHSIVKLAPSQLENAEKLEQLRWLENGFPIIIGTTSIKSWSVDMPEDVAEIERIIREFNLD